MRVKPQASIATDTEVYRGFLLSLSDDFVKKYYRSTPTGFRFSVCDFLGELSPDIRLSHRFWCYKVDLDVSRQCGHHYKLPPDSDETYHKMFLECYDERLDLLA